MDAPNFVALEHPSDKSFSGPVTFAVPSVYGMIAIDARKAQLSGPAGFEALTAAAQLRVTVVATLERVIETAPKGFYVDDGNGKPYLSFAKVLELDEDQIVTIYSGYLAYRSWVREGRFGTRAPASGGNE